MIYLIITVGILYAAFTYKEALTKLAKFFAISTAKTKAMIVLFFATVFLLILPEVVPSALAPAAFAYLLIANIYQVWSIVRVGKSTGVKWPKGSTTLVISALLVLWTPLADMILGRGYESVAGVAFAAGSLSFILLYMIEIYQRNIELMRSSRV